MLAKTIRYPFWGRKSINNGVTTCRFLWPRALRSFSRFARAHVYRSGPANSPVLQACTYHVLKALTYRTYSITDMYMMITTTALLSNSSNSPKTYIWHLKLLRIDTKQNNVFDMATLEIYLIDLLLWRAAVNHWRQESCLETRIAHCKRDDAKGRDHAIFWGSRFAVWLPEKFVAKGL